jgi:hypothetical protein
VSHPQRKAAHAAPVGHTHATPTAPAVSDFAALLGGAVGQSAPAPAPEPSLFDGLLAGTLGSGKRRRLVICGVCGERNCVYSHYVDE